MEETVLSLLHHLGAEVAVEPVSAAADRTPAIDPTPAAAEPVSRRAWRADPSSPPEHGEGRAVWDGIERGEGVDDDRGRSSGDGGADDGEHEGPRTERRGTESGRIHYGRLGP